MGREGRKEISKRRRRGKEERGRRDEGIER